MITLIIPYYSQPGMLEKQLEVVTQYPGDISVIVVDDGSKIPAKVPRGIKLARIEEDVPWNREQARNLGAYLAKTDWIIQVDIDHILPVSSVTALLDYDADVRYWYRFPRYRVGAADETRQKDMIAKSESGWIHPHIDSYLIPRLMFLSSPYDERYAGCLGGGTPFLDRLTRLFGPPRTLPHDIYLEVHTRHSVEDSSVSLNRDKKEYTRRRNDIGMDDRPRRILCHPWHQVQ